MVVIDCQMTRHFLTDQALGVLSLNDLEVLFLREAKAVLESTSMSVGGTSKSLPFCLSS
jgi:hypothetical protein